MNFTGLEYLLFLAVVVPIFRLSPIRLRPIVLLVVSYLFYLSFSVTGAFLLAAATTFAYLTGLFLEFRPTKTGAIAGIAAIVLTAFLMLFKVAAVVPGHLGGLVMPLGISYYTFRLISYVLDVQRGIIAPERDVLAFFAYVSFFPQLVAGPIQRPRDFFQQLPPQPTEYRLGVERIAVGLFKKMLVADNLGVVVNHVYGHMTSITGGPLWLALYLFPLQLYADFSGLTDVALGSGMLLGIRGPENFNRPFTATSISDYWRRWHMSLTSWLGDYVFTPLRMLTRNAGNWGLVFSLTINMLAIALWHGLTWGYFLFGCLQSAFISGDALTSRMRSKYFKKHPQLDRPAALVGQILTFTLVATSTVFFRARSVHDPIWLFSHLFREFHWSLGPLAGLQFTRPLRIGLAGYLLVELGERFRPDKWMQDMLPQWPRWARWSAYSAGALMLVFGLLLLLAQAGGPKNPFLYEIY